MKQGDLLKTLRKGTGLNQSTFGDLIGKAQEDISDFENNKQVLKQPDWIRIAKLFKSEVAQMMADALLLHDIVDFNKIKMA